MTQERPKSGKAIKSVKDRLDESLSSILILNTFAHTMGAAGVGAQALRVFGPEAETLIAFADAGDSVFLRDHPEDAGCDLLAAVGGARGADDPVAGAPGLSTGVGVDTSDPTAGQGPQG